MRGGTFGPTLFFIKLRFGAGFCPAAGNRRQDSCLPGKTGARCGQAARKNRGRARLGKNTNPVRELPAAGAPEKQKEQSSSFSGVSVRGGTFGPTFYIFMEVWRELSPCGFPPCLGEQGLGFFPAWENRSRALGLHSEKNACVRGAGKEKTGCAICPAQPRVRARLGKNTNPVRDLLTASVNSGCGLRRWCAGSRGPCDCRACRGTRHKPF